MVNEKKYSRLGARYGRRVFIFGSIVFIFSVIIASVVFFWAGQRDRITLVIAADPVTIASFNRSDHKLVLLTFPAAAEISGVHGVGKYSLASLWQLGKIDSRDRKLLSDSLGVTSGIDITNYLGFSGNDLPAYQDGPGLVRRVFSPGEFWSFINGKFISDLTPIEFLTLIGENLKLGANDITSLSSERQGALVELKRPDGSSAIGIDPDRLNILTGTNFEDAGIRSEGAHVAIFNTTTAPLLGSLAERMLTHSGILVVMVDNGQPELGGCELSGRKKYLESLTGKFIKGLYHCRAIETEEGDRADLILKLGRDYEDLFLPRK